MTNKDIDHGLMFGDGLTYSKVGAHCATTNKIFSYQVKLQGGAMFF